MSLLATIEEHLKTKSEIFDMAAEAFEDMASSGDQATMKILSNYVYNLDLNKYKKNIFKSLISLKKNMHLTELGYNAIDVLLKILAKKESAYKSFHITNTYEKVDLSVFILILRDAFIKNNLYDASLNTIAVNALIDRLNDTKLKAII